MKPVSEWDEEHILSLPLGEFDWLEAKGRRALDLTVPGVTVENVLATISKEVSAFANSGGGRLIYGLVDPKAGDTEWQVDDGGISVAIKKNGTKEWLETVIPNQMEPALQKFNVYAILPSMPDSKIEDGRALFVIEVPDSQDAPHQAADKRYYARVASRAQPIGHRLVMDIVNRRQHPKIEVSFSLGWHRSEEINTEGGPLPGPQIPYDIRSERGTFRLNVRASNHGRVYARHTHIRVFVPQAAVSGGEKRPTEQIEGEVYCVFNFDNGSKPILPTLHHEWTVVLQPITSASGISRSLGDECIFWEAYADNSPPSQGQSTFAQMPNLG